MFDQHAERVGLFCRALQMEIADSVACGKDAGQFVPSAIIDAEASLVLFPADLQFRPGVGFQARDVIDRVQQQINHEQYFPKRKDLNKILGKPVRDWGQLQVGVVALNGQAASGETLIANARAALEERSA